MSKNVLYRGILMVLVAALLGPMVAPARAQCLADLNATGTVDGADLATLLSAWGQVGAVVADINNDGLVDGVDLGLVVAGWGPCAGPEWATVLDWIPDPTVVTDATLRAGISATGLPWRVRDNASNIEMLLVPPGTFTMGCSPSLQYGCDSDETPTHSVTLTNAFYLGRYEVTQAQWQAEMGSNPSSFTGYSDSPSRPVEQVSWNTIQPFLTQNGLRLPTEAEWEYAYRAGTTTAFHGWPANPNGTNTSSEALTIAWCWENNSPYGTKPVGGKPTSGFGLHDMAGSVWEWCQDWYGSYSSGAATNPTGPSSGNNRVIRGGSWGGNSGYCRASNRFGDVPDYANVVIGFRAARNP